MDQVSPFVIICSDMLCNVKEEEMRNISNTFSFK